LQLGLIWLGRPSNFIVQANVCNSLPNYSIISFIFVRSVLSISSKLNPSHRRSLIFIHLRLILTEGREQERKKDTKKEEARKRDTYIRGQVHSETKSQSGNPAGPAERTLLSRFLRSLRAPLFFLPITQHVGPIAQWLGVLHNCTIEIRDLAQPRPLVPSCNLPSTSSSCFMSSNP
jgi:hypothetical protein